MEFYQDGPRCEPRINASLPCVRIDQCRENAECLRKDSPTFTCHCNKGFYQSADLQCHPLKNVSVKCSRSDECTQGARCELEGQEGADGLCMCMSEFYQDADTCSRLRNASQSCDGEGQCVQNASCVGISSNSTQSTSEDLLTLSPISLNSSCVCNPGFFQDGYGCRPLILVDMPCAGDNQCTPGAFCGAKGNKLVCICDTAHFQNDSFCMPLINASRSCTAVGQCILGAECVDGFSVDIPTSRKICRCMDDFYEDSENICRPLINASRPCDFDYQCTTGAECIEIATGVTNCVCKEGSYFEDEFNKCRLLINASSPCTGVGQCIYGADCVENDLDSNQQSCVCQDHFYEDATAHTCESLKPPGANCRASNQCVLGAYCNTDKVDNGGNGVCSCQDQLYFQLGQECREKINATLPCYGPGQCVRGASCEETSDVGSNPNRFECVCNDGFYLERTACYVLKNASEPCTAKGQCILGAECLGEVGSSRCACVEGYYQDLALCKPWKNPGVSCEKDRQCIREAECVTRKEKVLASVIDDSTLETQTESLCSCRKDYYQSGSECVSLLNATMPCSAPGQCIDGAECKSLSNGGDSVTMMACACLNTHYMDDQRCFPLINATEKCTATEQCVPGATCEKVTSDLSLAPSTSSTCVCKDGFFNKHGLCKPLVNATDPCTVEEVCVDGAICEVSSLSSQSPNTSEIGVCTCTDGFYLEGKKCAMLKNASDPCLFDHQCVEGAMCLRPVFEQTCTCVGKYFQYGNKCKVFVNVTDPCDEQDKCVPNAVCTKNLFGESFCKCLPDFYHTDETCRARIHAGLPCDTNGTCTVGAVCSSFNNTCECTENFFTEGPICKPLVKASKPCDMTEHCVENALCDIFTRNCKCNVGFFETNGKCKESIDAGDVCVKAGTCTEFAECDLTNSSKCVCNVGYYNDEGDCRGLIPASLPCSKPGQCVTHASCNPKDFLCHCDNGFYEQGGQCHQQRLVDEACEEDKHCTLYSNCKVGTSNVCSCLPDFYKDGEGRCQPLITVSHMCNVSKQCVRNAFCDDSSSLCFCADGFYEKRGNCLERIDAEKPCDPFIGSTQCVNNSVCVPNEESFTNVARAFCKCESGFYSALGQCSLLLTHGAPCSETKQCVENSRCAESKTSTSAMSVDIYECQCVEGFYNDDQGFCRELIPAGETCSETRQCTFDASCPSVNGKCECDIGFYDNGLGKCELLIDAEQPCLYDSQCIFNASCPLLSDGVRRCICYTGFFSTEGQCELLRDPGQSCNETRECVDHSTCSRPSETCECLSGYYNSSQGVCEPLKHVDESCVEDRECIDDASCSNGSCTCDEGFYVEWPPRTCSPIKPPGAGCDASLQCTAHADCLFDITGKGTCFCTHDYHATKDDSGKAIACEERFPASSPCTSTAQCTHHSRCIDFALPSESLDLISTCVCEPDYYETRDHTCTERILAGVACNTTDQCVVSAVCSESLETSVTDIISQTGNPAQEIAPVQVCRCSEGFFNMNGHCLPLLAAGRRCNSTDQCVKNADCTAVLLDIKACSCRKQFYMDASGLCQPKVPVGSFCTHAAHCRDRAFCDLDSYPTNTPGVCQCEDGYYNNDGFCEERVAAGQVCDPSVPLLITLDGRGADQCTDFASCISNDSVSGTCLCGPSHYNHAGVCKELIGAGEIRCCTDLDCQIKIFFHCVIMLFNDSNLLNYGTECIKCK